MVGPQARRPQGAPLSARRTRYFTGRLLTAEDFQREQAYLLDRSRRHNRFLHGWGIVAGLDVELGHRSREIEVSPGIAIDCAGNEIVVPSVVCVKLPRAAKQVFVALSYHEVEEQWKIVRLKARAPAKRRRD